MTTRNQDIGANLEELYKGGAQEFPPIAQSFHSAGSILVTASATEPLSHHAELGLGSTGPSAGYNELKNAIASCCRNSGDVMDDVAAAIVKTAQNMAETDAEIRDAFLKAGGKLHG